MLYQIHPRHEAGFELTTLVVIGTDCTVNYKFNYLTITTTTAPTSKETSSRYTRYMKYTTILYDSGVNTSFWTMPLSLT
jgi:hypothetical protein